MIDTEELRRLAQAATHPTTKGRWMRLFGERTVYDRMEDGCRGVPIVAADHHPPGPQAAAYLDFIAAANPAAISELLDRLEAAERERDECNARRLEAADHFSAQVREISSALEETRRERDVEQQRACDLHVECCNLINEIDALRAKIEAMEKQEPLGTLHDDGCFVWRNGRPYESNYAGWKIALYTLPGAKGEEK